MARKSTKKKTSKKASKNNTITKVEDIAGETIRKATITKSGVKSNVRSQDGTIKSETPSAEEIKPTVASKPLVLAPKGNVKGSLPLPKTEATAQPFIFTKKVIKKKKA